MGESKGKFYVTTPIYYPSDNLHIGHAYCSVATDTIRRFKQIQGYDTYFLTGTDEHGQKIERKAEAKGVTPKAYVDEIVANIKTLWSILDISYDDFIRTTDDRHVEAVQKIFKQLYEQGDIYKGEYKGWYCSPCESFWTELQLKDHMCPDCGRPVEKTSEEAYFFKLSKYQDWLIKYIEEHPEFIEPEKRKNEMINNFLKPGLEDLCVSRTTINWGVPVDFDPKHTVYVWIDALSNYISALGYGTDHDELYQKYWPADLHVVGKEIIRFHTIIWPIMLHALGLPLPKKIFGHGWLVIDGQKMSKSRGNVVDPIVLSQKFGSDAIRYYLMREFPFGGDGQFTYESLLTRINADLANDLGNLVSRTVAMIEKYFGGSIPAMGAAEQIDSDLQKLALDTYKNVEARMEKLEFSYALQEIWKLVSECNRYIDQTQPWVLGKTEDGKARLSTVLYTLAECVRFIAAMIAPVMPRTPERICQQFGIEDKALISWDSLNIFGRLPAGIQVHKGEALFPRIDIAKELADFENGAAKAVAEAKQPPKKTSTPVKAKPETESSETTGLISIDDFDKVQLRVARVLACEKVEKSDKLLKLRLSLGDEERTVVSGIAKHYTPDEMVGKQVVLVANLKPAKLRGIESQGMILCASDAADQTLKLITVEAGMEDGATVR